MALTDGLISFWRLDGNSNDFFGIGNGTDANVTYSSANGKINQGAGFNGTSSVISNIGTVSSYNFIQNTGTFSFSCWVKTASTGASGFTKSIILNRNSTADKGFLIAQYTDGTTLLVNINYGSSGNYIWNISAANFFTNTSYHHLTVTADFTGNLITVYKDGVFFSSTSASGSTLSTGNSTNTLKISNTVTSNSWNGSLDEMGIWNRVLTQTEVTRLYNGGNGIPLHIMHGSF